MKTINTNADYISSEDYQTVKKWKNFNAAKWQWSNESGLYINVKNL